MILSHPKKTAKKSGLRVSPRSMRHVIRLQYFKPNGRWYTSTRYETTAVAVHVAIDELRERLVAGDAPGLPGFSPFASGYTVLFAGFGTTCLLWGLDK